MSSKPAVATPLVRAAGLTKVFAQPGLRLSHTRVHAVDGVDLDIAPRQAAGLVGESGSGKTTVARCLLRLVKPTSGTVTFDGTPVLELSREQLAAFRRQAQIVFQDPFASLDPRFTVAKAIAEPLRVHRICPRSEIESEAA